MFLKNKLFLLFAVLLFIINCRINTGNSKADYYFNKLAGVKNEQEFHSIDLNGIENINNKYYIKLYNMNKSINEYLLEKSYSLEITNWYFHPFHFQMTEGDIAIVLLLEKNLIEDDFYKIVPYEIKYEYIENGRDASIWWDYLHKDVKNRENIIGLIKEKVLMQ